jgi:hypothetical protein
MTWPTQNDIAEMEALVRSNRHRLMEARREVEADCHLNPNSLSKVRMLTNALLAAHDEESMEDRRPMQRARFDAITAIAYARLASETHVSEESAR